MTLVGAASAPWLLPSALANDGPRLSVHHHTIEYAGEDDEGDQQWRWAVTICSSAAARIKLRHAVRDADPGAVSYASWYVKKARAGCKRYRYYLSGNYDPISSRVRVWWRGLTDTTPWISATCQPNCY